MADCWVRMKWKETKRQLVHVFCVAAYIIGGILIYNAIEKSGNNLSPQYFWADWTYIDCFYFVSMTMCTVGYGDIAPTTTGSRVYTIVMVCISVALFLPYKRTLYLTYGKWMLKLIQIFVGISVVFPILGKVVTVTLGPMIAKCREVLLQIFPPKFIDVDGDGQADFVVPSHWFLHYTVALIPSVIFNLSIQLISAGIFCAIENVDTYKADGSIERSAWTFGDAFYHCLVTATTVGYGDVKIATQWGRLWSGFHMIISVIMVAECISTIGNAAEERAKVLEKVKRLKRRADLQLFDELMQEANILFKKDIPELGISEAEYSLMMLIKLGMVDEKEAKVFLKQFTSFGGGKDGRVTRTEMEEAARAEAQRIIQISQDNLKLNTQNPGRQTAKVISFADVESACNDTPEATHMSTGTDTPVVERNDA